MSVLLRQAPNVIAAGLQVDGFRFDIMGHMMVSTMDKIRKALDQLTVESDGIDGRHVYLYGEAWDFGEMAGNQRGRNANQINMAGAAWRLVLAGLFGALAVELVDVS